MSGSSRKLVVENPKTKTFGFHLPFSVSNATYLELDTSKVLGSILENGRKEMPHEINKSISLKSLAAESAAD